MLQQVLPFMSGGFEGFRSWARTQPWRQQQQQQLNSPNVPSLRTVQSQLQLCVQDVWLQLGLALRALCRRSSGEAAEEEEDENKGHCFMVNTGSGQLLGDVAPRQVFATYSEMLVAALTVSGDWAGQGGRGSGARGYVLCRRFGDVPCPINITPMRERC
jgi:hypothetical protein